METRRHLFPVVRGSDSLFSHPAFHKFLMLEPSQILDGPLIKEHQVLASSWLLQSYFILQRNGPIHSKIEEELTSYCDVLPDPGY